MSKRMMNMILCKKHESWLNSIEDEALRKQVEKNTIITGGCIASMLLKEEIKDFDFYFRDFDTCKAVAQYYVNKFIATHDNLKIKPEVRIENEETGKPIKFDPEIGKYIEPNEDTGRQIVENPKLRVRIRIQSAGVVGENTDDSKYQYFEGDSLRGGEALNEEGDEYIEQTFESPEQTLEKTDEIEAQDPANMHALGNLRGKNIEKGKFSPIYLTDNAITLSDKVQLVIRFYGWSTEIHENFDYVHCTNYWDSNNKKLELNEKALESLLTKRLYYIGSKYPICSIIRIRKFLNRGWRIDAGQILKICYGISKLDLNNINVLEDQLMGVDQAYFQQMVNYLREEKAKNENWTLDLPYLVSLIDKIF